jgi:hypothetical protein
MVKCPICQNPLKVKMGNLVDCARFHKFYVQWGTQTDRVLVLADDPKEASAPKKGSEFPVPDDATFD